MSEHSGCVPQLGPSVEGVGATLLEAGVPTPGPAWMRLRGTGGHGSATKS